MGYGTRGCCTSKENGAKERIVQNKIEDDFIPPDGGWGWMIVVAAGFSNFCIFPVLQSFGLIFKDRFQELGISSSEITTLINVNCAITSCIGLANGPLFRRYSYRQVSFVGSLLSAASIAILATMSTFTGAVIFFSILYGAGIGITMSATALALNTYFKEKRRIATGFSWTCTGMGPIIMPQIITLLMPIFGMQGTVLIFGGFAFNSVACALLLQPVAWHTKNKRETKEIEGQQVYTGLVTEKSILENGASSIGNSQSRSLENIMNNGRGSHGGLGRSKQKFGSQYLYYDDDEDGAAGYDIIPLGTPMMSRANDGWFSKKSTSNASLTSKCSRKESVQRSRRPSSMNLSRPASIMALSRGSSVKTLNRLNSETDNCRRKISGLPAVATPLIILNESCEHAEIEECRANKCEHKTPQKEVTNHREKNNKLNEFVELQEGNEKENEGVCRRFFKAVVIFFDLDLLRDLVYVNLMLGINFANFAELNFSLLTPFILGEYGFTRSQVATVMSVLAGVDVITRITIPFLAALIEWDNRTFFLVGVGGMAIGRIVLAHVNNFGVAIAVSVLIGAGKALRTIFIALVIPTHVPLSRLPAATGLQLLVSGLISLILGPAVGWIRDITGDYTLLLHVLNVFTYLTIISWMLESWYRRRKMKRQKLANQDGTQRLNA